MRGGVPQTDVLQPCQLAKQPRQLAAVVNQPLQAGGQQCASWQPAADCPTIANVQAGEVLQRCDGRQKAALLRALPAHQLLPQAVVVLKFEVLQRGAAAVQHCHQASCQAWRNDQAVKIEAKPPERALLGRTPRGQPAQQGFCAIEIRVHASLHAFPQLGQACARCVPGAAHAQAAAPARAWGGRAVGGAWRRRSRSPPLPSSRPPPTSASGSGGVALSGVGGGAASPNRPHGPARSPPGAECAPLRACWGARGCSRRRRIGGR